MSRFAAATQRFASKNSVALSELQVDAHRQQVLHELALQGSVVWGKCARILDLAARLVVTPGSCCAFCKAPCIRIHHVSLTGALRRPVLVKDRTHMLL